MPKIVICVDCDRGPIDTTDNPKVRIYYEPDILTSEKFQHISEVKSKLMDAVLCLPRSF